jgi:DNA-binding CsgD family transcriptional regulator
MTDWTRAERRRASRRNVRTYLRAILQYTDISRDPDLYTFAVGSRIRKLFSQYLFRTS